ncbi:hypothetical protein J1N35_023833 [Gossypium stocksii]|uniref:RNase H type-1 domain-containing protein n=1 Tax=Gossypium stocksii TaxID=47602 RepID=A0A9D3VKQ8_9ROSI|nr:hypothetical protein J1N35_042947 [Gossypium stocksii]KAH1084072.1 hypothetical protein J1N35_023833 [Gossypium stocksii]
MKWYAGTLVSKQTAGTSVQVSWSLPAAGWVKLNTDGAVNLGNSQARAGGILGDSNGNWLVGDK